MAIIMRLRCSPRLVFILLAALLAPFRAAAQPVPSESPAPVSDTGQTKSALALEYDRGFVIRPPDPNFKLRINGRVQVLYTLQLRPNAGNQSAFSIPRGRFEMSGHAFTPDLAYEVEIGFGGGFVRARDLYLDYTFVPRVLRLRAGQWKRPFSRQQIASGARLELVDRSITDDFFGAGRDIGVALHSGYKRSTGWEYAVGVFNGTGDALDFSRDVVVDPVTGDGQVVSERPTNVPERFGPALVARLGYNFHDIDGYSEADLAGGPFRAAVAANGKVDFDTDGDGRWSLQGGADYMLKAHGFSATGGLYAWRYYGPDSGSGHALGLHAQAGYVIGQTVQPAVRYAVIRGTAPDVTLHEWVVGLSTYIFDHNFKWQLDGGSVLSNNPDVLHSTYFVRTQLQVAL